MVGNCQLAAMQIQGILSELFIEGSEGFTQPGPVAPVSSKTQKARNLPLEHSETYDKMYLKKMEVLICKGAAATLGLCLGGYRAKLVSHYHSLWCPGGAGARLATPPYLSPMKPLIYLSGPLIPPCPSSPLV